MEIRPVRWNVLLAIFCGVGVLYFTWAQFHRYQERERLQAIEFADRKIRIEKLSLDGCNGVVASLASMEHRLLKAGGVQVPRALADDIELCLDEGIISSEARQRMEETRLIRLFPVEY